MTVVGGEKELHSEREGTRGAQGCPSPPPGLLSGFEAMAGAVLSHTWPHQLSLRKALLSRLDLASFPSLTHTTPCSPSLFPDSTDVCILVPSTVPSTVWKDQKGLRAEARRPDDTTGRPSSPQRAKHRLHRWRGLSPGLVWPWVFWAFLCLYLLMGERKGQVWRITQWLWDLELGSGQSKCWGLA